MQTKLTLRLDAKLIEHAKQYSKKTHKSLSQIVSDYFAMIDKLPAGTGKELPPITRSLQGALKGGKVSKKDYQKHLEDKYL